MAGHRIYFQGDSVITLTFLLPRWKVWQIVTGHTLHRIGSVRNTSPLAKHLEPQNIISVSIFCPLIPRHWWLRSSDRGDRTARWIRGKQTCLAKALLRSSHTTPLDLAYDFQCSFRESYSSGEIDNDPSSDGITPHWGLSCSTGDDRILCSLATFTISETCWRFRPDAASGRWTFIDACNCKGQFSNWSVKFSWQRFN